MGVGISLFQKDIKTCMLNICVMDCHLKVYLKMSKSQVMLAPLSKTAAKSETEGNAYIFECKELSQLSYLYFLAW